MTSSKKRILIVDDNSISLKVYKKGVEGENYEFVFCQCSIEAKKIIREQQFDGIITDLVMPVVNGIDLLNFANKHQSKNTFKFLITGSTELEIIIHIVNNIGIDKIFLKPLKVDGQELRESIRAYAS